MSELIEILERARQSEHEVSAQLEHIERLHRISRSAQKSAAYAREIADKLYNFEVYMNELVDKMVDAKRVAYEYISILGGDERAVIESYYILAKTWEQVADALFYSDRNIYNLRFSAVEKMEDYYARRNGKRRRRKNGNRKTASGASRARKAYAGGACGDNRRDAVCGG